MSAFTVVAIVVFGTGAFLGFFVTGFWLPDADGWWIPALVRVAWQLGGALAVGLGVAHDLRWPARAPRPWQAPLVCAAVGTLLCVNPLLDLVRGPARWRGHADLLVRRGTKSISATLTIHGADGLVEKVDLSGRRVNAVAEQLDECDGRGDVEAIVLRHTGVVLELRC